MNTTPVKKQKIAILGGGMAALTAAFELTSRPELRDRHEITVYQMGFRLGGKGASGRNQARADRIEEHGLHILMGFYHNAFSVLRRCYEELGRAPGTPLATIEEAIVPHGDLAIAELVDGRWEHWPLPFPPLPGNPGMESPEPLPTWGYLKKLVGWMQSMFAESPEVKRLLPGLPLDIADVDREIAPPSPARGRDKTGATGTLGARSLDGTGDPGDPVQALEGDPDEQRRRMEHLIDEAQQGRRLLPLPVYLHVSHLAGALGVVDLGSRIAWLLREFRAWTARFFAAHRASSTPLRRLWLLLDLGLTTVIGALADGVDRASDGWFSIDGLDFREWLSKHGASPETLDGALVRSLYNLAFTSEGKLAAGTILNATLRLLFSYKAGVFQKMQAGMGDVVFAPLYEVLRRRGVRFAFFHRVRDLVLSVDGLRVAAVVMGRQARPKGAEYHPLRDVGGLPCWPSEPKYEDLEEGETLRRRGETLESWWSDWPDVETLRLEEGRDFDRVVLGISIGAFPSVCSQLIAANRRFADMVEHVETIQTQAVQLWLRPDLEGMGWTHRSPVLDAFAGPFDTWADMTHLLPRERWPAEGGPRTLAYLCSHLDDEEGELPRGVDMKYPARQAERVKANAVAWLDRSSRGLWPAATARSGGFDWSLLHDPEGRDGSARLDAQHWQATVNPSDRYVRAVPGSVRYRLRANESGFENVVLAGDWVRTGLSVGCLEAATMAGMQAARAICGHPEAIPGDD